jgi:8-oxo-dGTP pyrophosphatase MutT (NUDIX family)
MSLIEQSSVIPYCFKKGRLKVMIITSTGDRVWILPKGHLEPNLSPAESAAKEALEEAGVTGKIESDVIFSYQFERNKSLAIRVDVFVLKVECILDDWDESDIRERRLVDFEEAVRLVHYQELKNALKRLPEYLEEQKA